MLGSSIVTVTKDGKTEELFRTTASGILVVDRHGDLFITVATHGFEDNGLIYHPNPRTGILIGKILDSLPGTDISLAKLNRGLRYINETFGTTGNPLGIQANGISSGYAPHLRIEDGLSMNSPFSGSCNGLVMGNGAIIPENGDHEYVPHEWCLFENGDEPVYGSCGSPIMDSKGNVISLFRYKMENSSDCFAVSVKTLREYGYEICSGEQTF
jgi:hypothetical protein